MLYSKKQERKPKERSRKRAFADHEHEDRKEFVSVQEMFADLFAADVREFESQKFEKGGCRVRFYCSAVVVMVQARF